MKTKYMKPEIQVVKMNGECTMAANSIRIDSGSQNDDSRSKIFELDEADNAATPSFTNPWDL